MNLRPLPDNDWAPEAVGYDYDGEDHDWDGDGDDADEFENMLQDHVVTRHRLRGRGSGSSSSSRSRSPQRKLSYRERQQQRLVAELEPRGDLLVHLVRPVREAQGARGDEGPGRHKRLVPFWGLALPCAAASSPLGPHL